MDNVKVKQKVKAPHTRQIGTVVQVFPKHNVAIVDFPPNRADKGGWRTAFLFKELRSSK